MDLPPLSVCEALLRSHATPQRAAPVGDDGAWLVQWRNADTEAEYLRPGHHTLSLYLEGGEAVRCREAPAARGAPGRLCLMPAGHESRWDVHGALRLLHVYLPRLSLATAAECWLDLDPRCAELDERIFFDDPALTILAGRLVLLDWSDADAQLLMRHLLLDIEARLLGAHLRPVARGLRGGLSPLVRRRVLDHIESALAQGEPSRLSLRALADTACLSEYHFARMFKASFGQSPHAWVMQRRLQHARQWLASGRLSAADVAERTGYAHASHLNAALRRAGLGSAARYAELTRT